MTRDFSETGRASYYQARPGKSARGPKHADSERTAKGAVLRSARALLGREARYDSGARPRPRD